MHRCPTNKRNSGALSVQKAAFAMQATRILPVYPCNESLWRVTETPMTQGDTENAHLQTVSYVTNTCNQPLQGWGPHRPVRHTGHVDGGTIQFKESVY